MKTILSFSTDQSWSVFCFNKQYIWYSSSLFMIFTICCSTSSLLIIAWMQYVSSLGRLCSHKQHTPANVLALTCLLIRNLTMTNQAIQTLPEFSSSPSDASQIQELLAVPQRRRTVPTSPHGLKCLPLRVWWSVHIKAVFYLFVEDYWSFPLACGSASAHGVR